jgi:hypothetical protein
MEGATPLAGHGPTSRGVTRRSKDADRIDLGRTSVPTRPHGVSTPTGLAFDTTPLATEAARWPFLRFRAPAEASIADPPGPADPWAGSSDRASSPGLSCPTTHSRETGACRPRFQPRPWGTVSEVWLPPSRSPPASLPAREAPERPWASPFRAPSPCAARAPLGVAALLALSAPAPHRGVHTGARSPPGLCSRHGSVPSSVLVRPTVAALLGFTPSERSLHPSGRVALVARPPLPSRIRADVPARRDPRVLRSRWIGVARLRAAGSLGVRHLMTVAALRSSGSGAGSWIHLAPPRSLTRASGTS